jgi:hypothetical protein
VSTVFRLITRNDLYENLENRVVVEETKSMPNALVNRMTECREIGHGKKVMDEKSQEKNSQEKKSQAKKSHI